MSKHDTTVERLAAIARWLDSAPDGHSRDCTIEIGTYANVHATVRLSAAWIPRGPTHVPEGLRPLGGRVYSGEGNTLAEALGQLHVPRATRQRRTT